MERINFGTAVIFCALLGGFLTGYIAYIKARRHIGDWAIYGALLPFIALPHIIGAESLPTNSERRIAIRKLIFRLRWLFYPLTCVAFYKLVTVADKVTYTEGLFPSADGTLVAAVFFPLMGLVTASIAHTKGRNNIGDWFIYGTLLSLLAFPHVILVDSRPEISESRRKGRR